MHSGEAADWRFSFSFTDLAHINFMLTVGGIGYEYKRKNAQWEIISAK